MKQVPVNRDWLEAMRIDDDGVPFGNTQIETKNGSIYNIDIEGTMSCIKGKREGKVVGLALGAVYRAWGPIRPGRAVIGLGIEARNGELVTVTTPVVHIWKVL